MRGKRKKKKEKQKRVHCTFKGNKANIAPLGSEAEIKELDWISYIELNFKMQFAVRKAHTECCRGVSPLTFCFPEASK